MTRSGGQRDWSRGQADSSLVELRVQRMIHDVNVSWSVHTCAVAGTNVPHQNWSTMSVVMETHGAVSLLTAGLPARADEIGDWPDLTDRTVRMEFTPAAIRALAHLVEKWSLTVREMCDLLGGVSESSWHSWQKHEPEALTVDQLMRTSLLLGIYGALQVIHSGDLADEWVRLSNSNRLFGGRTPLESMLTGGIPAMVEVRALLDGRRAGW